MVDSDVIDNNYYLMGPFRRTGLLRGGDLARFRYL